MSRFVLVLELVLGIIALSISLSGTSPFFFLVFTPFLLVLLLPCLAVTAVLPLSVIVSGLKSALSLQNPKVTPESRKMFDLFEKTSYAGAFIGFIGGVSIFLQKSAAMSPDAMLKTGKDALLGVCYALIAAIVFNMISGRFFHSRNFTAETVPDAKMTQFAGKFSISKREREIIQLVISGKSNRDIAGFLFISEDTVKNHIYNIFQKTGVRNRSELISRILTLS